MNYHSNTHFNIDLKMNLTLSDKTHINFTPKGK